MQSHFGLPRAVAGGQGGAGAGGKELGCQAGSDPASPAAIFCDYYNPPDECEWHYEPCGNRSFETCRTVNGFHSNISVSYLEGECAPGAEGGVP